MENILYERLSFAVEWYQEEAALMRQFLLNYFPCDRSVEMFDRKKNKTFLKRVCVPGLSEKNLDIGAKLNIFGRQVIIAGFEDEYTRKKMSSQRQKAFGLIPAKYLPKLSEIIKIICDNGFSINNCAMYDLDLRQCNDITKMLGFDMSDNWCSGLSLAIVLTGSDAFNRLKQLIAGPERQTNEKFSSDLIYGNGAMTDAVFYPNSADDVLTVCNYFFPKSSDATQLQLAKSLENSTLCLIKPHAILEGNCGDILLNITSNGFVIKAMKMFNLRRPNCEEFYEVYNGVSSDYLQMVTELSSGPFIALEIGSFNQDIHPYREFRQLCGPFDPEIAREIRSKTIRARYGVNAIKNAVHCTDLEEDCLLEVEYFFKILSQ